MSLLTKELLTANFHPPVGDDGADCYVAKGEKCYNFSDRHVTDGGIPKKRGESPREQRQVAGESPSAC